VTLRKDCKCGCHAAPNAAVHIHPCCGPGSEGWPHKVVLPNERDPFKIITLFGMSGKPESIAIRKVRMRREAGLCGACGKDPCACKHPRRKQKFVKMTPDLSRKRR